MELTIDGRPCDLGPESVAVPGFSAASLQELSAAREGRKVTLLLPPTPDNDVSLGDPLEPHALERFNSTLHQGELRAEGSLLLAGTVRLLSASREGYWVELRDGAAGWARLAAQTLLRELPVRYLEPLTLENIAAGWTNDDPVKFFPIVRDSYPPQSNGRDLLTAERLLTVDDYHPFLQLRAVIDALFAAADYRVESRFLDSPYFRSLYMSGAYASHKTAAITARMGFRAGRTAAVDVAGSPNGWVYTDPSRLEYTVGNIVDTATPGAIDASGQPIEGLYNNSGVFSEGYLINYRPTSAVDVAFDYHLRYTTDHRIATRQRLTGYDSIHLASGSQFRFALANRYVDRRGHLAANRRYRLIIFGHEAGEEYRMTACCDGITQEILSGCTTRASTVETPPSVSVTEEQLWRREGSQWVPYAEDWALYDGYIEEYGRTTVELQLRTAPIHVTPESPRYFNDVCFFGAEGGMHLTLEQECTVEAHFGNTPALCAAIDFPTVAQQHIYAIEVLEALAHMFNLRFYTDEPARKVYIEPYDDFYASPEEVDWCERVDFAEPIVLSDRALEVHEVQAWGYRSGDGAVTRYNRDEATELGTWECPTPSYAAKMGRRLERSPLFSPTLSVTECYNNAPSALLLSVGDRDDVDADAESITPRIVRYMGLHPLPEGECWGYPLQLPCYPLAAFHFPGDAYASAETLCFENRDGAEGLNRYYRRCCYEEGHGSRIEASVRLAPHEFAALLTPGLDAPEVRSTFRIATERGTLRVTLEALPAYNPEASSCRCRFRQTACD